MRVLIGAGPGKFFHTQEFIDVLVRHGVECKLVSAIEFEPALVEKQSSWFLTRKKYAVSLGHTALCQFPNKTMSSWYFTKANNLFDEFNPDVVLVDRQAHLGLAALNKNLPLLIQLHGDYWSELRWAKVYKNYQQKCVLWFRNKMAERCFRDSTMILPVCNYLKGITDKRYPGKSRTLYYGINPKRWDDKLNEHKMNLKHPCVGLLQDANTWGKAREMLILPKVLEAMPNVTFYWAGGGGYYKDKILSTLSKYNNFKWLGSLNYPDDVRSYLAEIDVYALISGLDMPALSLREAELMQKPVIATNVCGIPEGMIDGKSGYLVERQNPEQIIARISELLEDKRKSKEMGKNGRKFVEEHFNWDTIAKNFIDITKTIL